VTRKFQSPLNHILSDANKNKQNPNPGDGEDDTGITFRNEEANTKNPV
jgi:hypothetical protein